MKNLIPFSFLVSVYIIVGCGGTSTDKVYQEQTQDSFYLESGLPVGATKADSYYEDEANEFERELEELASVDVGSFLSFFGEININDLHVYSLKSREYDTYMGSEIDSKYAPIFRNTDLSEYFDSDDPDFDVFACYHIPMNDTIEGLIIRHYGMFSPNQLSLYFMNTAQKKIMSNYKLASYWGDEGKSFNTESWIREGTDELVIVSKTVNQDMETGTVLTDSMTIMLTNGMTFERNDLLPLINPEMELQLKN